MAQKRGGWYRRLGLASLLAMGGANAPPIASLGDCALAQVTSDGTLGAESSVVKPTNIDGLPAEQIDGGATRGANLFHSFEQFSIPTGSAAYFNNALDIQNIISRVTGSSLSNINGLIKANGTANLFLLNPKGIIFGPNTSLNIGGSFLASTASSLNFADGTQFSATAPQNTPLLTISVPIGLQYGGAAADIQNQSQATNSSSEVVGLQVQSGKTLALVGGDVSLDSGSLQAPGGRVELGGVAGAGTVGLNLDGNNLRLSFPDNVARADVSLSNGARVNVTAGGGGSVAVNARNLDILGGSSLTAGIGQGLGAVDSQAGDITLNATGVITISQSGIENIVNPEGEGNGGDIDITAGDLYLKSGAVLATIIIPEANNTPNLPDGREAGDVTLDVQDEITIDGGSEMPPAVFTGTAASGAVGNAGDIKVKARALTLTGSVLDADNNGKGNGGDIDIEVESLSLNNEAELSTQNTGQGNAGSITVLADSVSLANNSRSLSSVSGPKITVSSSGEGAAGNITVLADSIISLDNESSIQATTVAGSQGNITLRSPTLILRQSSQITTNATNTATGGNISINTDILAALENSDISANALEGPGGRITINARGIFGTEFRNQQTPESDITATSNLGPEFSGIVEINTPDVDPSRGLINLPAVPLNIEVVQACQPGGSQQQSKFVVTGRGGLPPSPNDALSSDAIQVDWVALNPGVVDSSSSTVSTKPTNPAPEPLVEAQGWVINDKDEVILTATAPNVTPNNPWMRPLTCYSSTFHQQSLALSAR